MISIFADMVEAFMEVFTNDFSVVGDSFMFEAFGNGVVKVCGFKFGPQLGKVSLYGERRNCAWAQSFRGRY